MSSLNKNHHTVESDCCHKHLIFRVEKLYNKELCTVAYLIFAFCKLESGSIDFVFVASNFDVQIDSHSIKC
jgi:3-polyprenyl-4-hydroxybenzoate decarboxylase